MELNYRTDLNNEQIRKINLVLARAYERSKTHSIVTANLINDLTDSMEPQEVRDAMKELYKSGFFYTPALFTELNDDTFFILREEKEEEAKKVYELFNVRD